MANRIKGATVEKGLIDPSVYSEETMKLEEEKEFVVKKH